MDFVKSCSTFSFGLILIKKNLPLPSWTYSQLWHQTYINMPPLGLCFSGPLGAVTVAAVGGAALESECLCANLLCAFVWVWGLCALMRVCICGHAWTNERRGFFGFGGLGGSCAATDSCLTFLRLCLIKSGSLASERLVWKWSSAEQKQQ